MTMIKCIIIKPIKLIKLIKLIIWIQVVKLINIWCQLWVIHLLINNVIINNIINFKWKYEKIIESKIKVQKNINKLF